MNYGLWIMDYGLWIMNIELSSETDVKVTKQHESGKKGIHFFTCMA
jgi:hypothetical protein